MRARGHAPGNPAEALAFFRHFRNGHARTRGSGQDAAGAQWFRRPTFTLLYPHPAVSHKRADSIWSYQIIPEPTAEGKRLITD